MTAVEALRSVLCDPEGRCCIAGSDEDRRIVTEALNDLEAAPTVQPLSDTELINRGCRYETELTAPTVQDSDALSVREIVLMNERYAHAKKMQKEQTP